MGNLKTLQVSGVDIPPLMSLLYSKLSSKLCKAAHGQDKHLNDVVRLSNLSLLEFLQHTSRNEEKKVYFPLKIKERKFSM